MKKCILAATVVLSFCMVSAAAMAAEPSEALFKSKCAACHPDGGNIMNPKLPLKGIKDAKKIITQVRKGGGAMPAFDAKAISDADLKKLAAYIMKTFKK